MANVARYLYKSESIMVYISGMKIGGNLTIKKWMSRKNGKSFYWKECAFIFQNKYLKEGFYNGFKYRMVFCDILGKLSIGSRIEDFNDLKELNEIFQENIFNEKSLDKYNAYMVEQKLIQSK